MKKIYLGNAKPEIDYNLFQKVVLIGDKIEIPHNNVYHITVAEGIMYKHYNKLLQEIDKKTLVILNEVLKKNRYTLEFNCIRRYVLQTDYVIVMSYFPFIEEKEEFMLLYDFIQPNPYWKEQYKYITKFENVFMGDIDYKVNVINKITTSEEIKKKYEEEKEKIISQVDKDPEIIPRRLLKFADKIRGKESDKLNILQSNYNLILTDLKVDHYYYNKLIKYGYDLNEFKEILKKSNLENSK